MKAGRDYRDFLRDIIEYSEKAERIVAGLDFEAFLRNDEKILAVVRTLEVIGEAARHIPKSLRSRYSKIPWEDMAGMRSKLIHEYFGVAYEVVWRTVQEDLSPLRAAVARMLADLEADACRK